MHKYTVLVPSDAPGFMPGAFRIYRHLTISPHEGDPYIHFPCTTKMHQMRNLYQCLVTMRDTARDLRPWIIDPPEAVFEMFREHGLRAVLYIMKASTTEDSYFREQQLAYENYRSMLDQKWRRAVNHEGEFSQEEAGGGT